MALKKNLEDALNEQVNKEFYSAYLYLSMAAHCESKNLKGFAHWLKIQAKEELGHAMKIFNFIAERGGKVELKGINEPPKEWDSLVKMFEDVYNHERMITESINNILTLARQENDYATEVFLHWFIDEQVEEEAQSLEVLETLKMVKDHPQAIFMIDRKMGERKE